MLLLSSRYGKHKYGITDTDDGVEQIVSYEDIKSILALGIKIEGVVANVKRYSRRRCDVAILQLNIIQNPDTQTMSQKKHSLLNGVDVIVNNGVITHLYWKSDPNKQELRVVLSNFANKCGDYILDGDRRENNTKLIIVLDDKVKIKANTFAGAFNCCDCRIDICNVTDESVAKRLYETWGSKPYRGVMEWCIIDNPDRSERWGAISYIYFHYSTSRTKFSPRAVAYLDVMFYDEFKSLLATRISLNITVQSMTALNMYKANILRREDYRERLQKQDYLPIRRIDQLEIFDVMTKCTMSNPRILSYFKNYMQYFDPSIKMQNLYIELCRRFAKAVLEDKRYGKL